MTTQRVGGSEPVSGARGGEPPVVFEVPLESARPTRDEIARAVFRHFGFTEKDAGLLRQKFGTDPVKYFARTLDFNPRSISGGAQPSIRIKLSADDYRALRELSSARQTANTGAASTNTTAQTDPAIAVASREGITSNTNTRAALEAKLTQTNGAANTSTTEEGLGSALEGAILGDFSENSSWSKVGGQVGVGLIPIVGQIADARDTVKAVGDIVQGKEGGWKSLGLAAIGWVPLVGDSIKGGARVLRKGVLEVTEGAATKTLKAVPEDVLVNALKQGFKTRRMQFGEQVFQLDSPGMKHILQRHHPEYWDGTVKATQTFLNSKMSIEDVGDAVEAVMRQNRDTLIQKGTNGVYQITGEYQGVKYVVGVNNGRVGQFFPAQ